MSNPAPTPALAMTNTGDSEKMLKKLIKQMKEHRLIVGIFVAVLVVIAVVRYLKLTLSVEALKSYVYNRLSPSACPSQATKDEEHTA